MKSKTIYIALFSLVIVYTSCSKITEDIQEDIFVNDTVSFNIPMLSNITRPDSTVEISSALNLEAQIKKSLNNFTIANIKTTRITSLNLKLDTLPKLDVNNNFSNLETLKFGISAGGNVAYLANITIPSTSTIISLPLAPSILPDDLKPFLVNSPKYKVVVKAKKITTTPMKVKGTLTYTITLSK